MTLSIAAIKILRQLAELVNQIQDSDFYRPSETLGGSTIGQHIRHTLEFFICYEAGYRDGILNYDRRPHDKLIENDKIVAMSAIRRAIGFIDRTHGNKPLKLEAGYDLARDEYITVDTNAQRELIYNIEHAVHHMAIIKIGVREVAPYINLEADFGVAASTLRHAMAGAYVSKPH